MSRALDTRIADALRHYAPAGHHVTCEARIGRGMDLETGVRGGPWPDLDGPVATLRRADGTPLRFGQHPRLTDAHGRIDAAFADECTAMMERVRALLLSGRRAGPWRRLRPLNRLSIAVYPDAPHEGGLVRDDRLALRLLAQRTRRALGLAPLARPRTARQIEATGIAADLRAAVDETLSSSFSLPVAAGGAVAIARSVIPKFTSMHVHLLHRPRGTPRPVEPHRVATERVEAWLFDPLDGDTRQVDLPYGREADIVLERLRAACASANDAERVMRVEISSVDPGDAVVRFVDADELAAVRPGDDRWRGSGPYG